MTYYLAHARTPDSKNGERRYQNKDGTGTPLGLARRREQYRREHPPREEHGKGFTKEDFPGDVIDVDPKDVTDVGKKKKGVDTEWLFNEGPKGKSSPAEKIVNNIDEGVNDIRKVGNGLYGLKKKKNSPDLSDVTDEELRKRVNRLQMERNYNSLTGADINKGKEKFNSIMDVAGGLTGLAASSLVVYLLIKKAIKGGAKVVEAAS